MSSRPVAVTAGASEYRYIKVTETTGKDIHSDNVTACIAPYGVTPAAGDFAAPASVTHPTNDVVIVGVLVSSSNAVAGKLYRVWAKISDAPEVVPVRAPQSFLVT